jgi:hypothetical protein
MIRKIISHNTNNDMHFRDVFAVYTGCSIKENLDISLMIDVKVKVNHKR